MQKNRTGQHSRYFRVCGRMTDSKSWFLGGPRHPDGREIAAAEFHKGQSLQYELLEVPILRGGEPTDVSWSPYELLIVTPRAADYFQRFLGDTIQLIPSVSTGGHELFVVNSLLLLDSIDHPHSKYSRYPTNYPLPHCAGQIDILWAVALKPDVINDYHFFRLSGKSQIMLMSREFATWLEDAGVNGIGENPIPEVLAI